MNNLERIAFIRIAVIACILMTGLTCLVMGDEPKIIPDHSSFQTCQPCHAEISTAWDASDHRKSIIQAAVNDPAATKCDGCHNSKKSEASKAGASFHKVSCLACHNPAKSGQGILVMESGELCGSCHTQRAIFWGHGAKGIEDSRNFHSGVPCVSCHMTEGNHRMKVLRPDDPGLTETRLDTCTACHKDNNRAARVEQIQEWQSTYDENMAPLLADVKAVEAALKKNPGLLNASLKSKLEDVKANLALMENDRSRGFHNFVFSLEIAALAKDSLKEIKAAIQ